MKLHLVAAALALLPAAYLGAAEKYAIELTREFKVGQKFEIAAVARENQIMKVIVDGSLTPSDPRQNKNLEVTIVGMEEILAVKKDGSHGKSRVKITKCVAQDAGKGDPVTIEPGTEVVVTYGDTEVTFAIEGNPASEAQASVLGKFFETKKSGTDDDELLGTDEKQAVGDKWKIDSKAAAESLAKNGMALKPEDIEGWMELVSVVEQDGVSCLEIRGEITLKKIAAPMPPGIAVTASGGKMTLHGLFPIDGTAQPVKKVMTMTFAVDAGGDANGAEIKLSMNGKTSRDGTMKELK